jgi:hypothetical protein
VSQSWAAGPTKTKATPFLRTIAETVVDFHAGTITASGGAAADIRLPSTDVARVRAERQARTRALAKLRAGLEQILPRPPSEAVLKKARAAATDYQSNGGVTLSLQLRFADLSETANDPALTLTVPTMRPEIAPSVEWDGKRAVLGWAIYRLGPAPARSKALTARTSAAGLLTLTAAPADLEKLTGAGAVIHVQKILE